MLADAPKKLVPSKRLKSWRRNFGGGRSLREFARYLAATGRSDERDAAVRWLRGKGVRS
jgi:hypothetical protein